MTRIRQQRSFITPIWAAITFFLILLLCSTAKAQTLPGYDVLGLARYCDTFLKAPKLPALSTLMSTFGDPLPCVEKRIAQGELSLVQVDLIDATCWRNRVCPPGTPKPSDLRVIKSRAAEVRKLAVRNPHIKFQVSPALEHDEKDPSVVQKMLEASKQGCPECEVIQSPFSGKIVPGYLVEKHGTRVRSELVSGDGASLFDADNIASDGNGFEHRTSGRIATFAWFNELNLRCTGEKSFTPPLKRTERPSLDLFTQAALVMRPEQGKPLPPPQCKKLVGFQRGEIHKTNAEAYCNGQPKDSRGNKNLLILKRKGKSGDKIKVVNFKGQEVSSFYYYGSFSEPGLFRWYISGLTPVQLMRKLENEWGYVILGGGQCLEFNSIRRQGVYR